MSFNGHTQSIIRISGAIAAVLALLGIPFAVQTYADNRYLQRYEITEVKNAIVENRRSQIEDELYRLELIPVNKRTDADRAQIERFKRQLQEIDSKRRQSSETR